MENKIFIFSEDELKELFIKCFIEGAHSYDNRKGQPDTCWSNIHQDAEEFASHLCNK